MTRPTWKIRVNRRLRCWDGDVLTDYVPELCPNGLTWSTLLTDYQQVRTAEEAQRIALQKSDELSRFAVIQMEPMVTTKKHFHIGGFGSPRRFECRALEGK